MNETTKNERIKKIFKILCSKEDLDKGLITAKNFKTYVLNQYVEFAGYEDMNKDLQETIVAKLRGLYKICDELSQDEVKSIVLKMCNLMARG